MGKKGRKESGRGRERRTRKKEGKGRMEEKGEGKRGISRCFEGASLRLAPALQIP